MCTSKVRYIYVCTSCTSNEVQVRYTKGALHGPAHQVRPCGLMDKAPDFGSGDCRFESCHGRINKFLNVIQSKYLAPGEARTHNPGISLCTVYKYRALTDCATGANC